MPSHLKEHNYNKTRRRSSRHAESAQQPGVHRQCPCCRDQQVRRLDSPIFRQKKVPNCSIVHVSFDKDKDADILLCVADLSQLLNLKPNHQPSAPTAGRPQKRKRTSVTPVSRPSAEQEVLDQVPTPQPSLVNLVPRLQSTIPPAELPVVSSVAPSSQPFTAPLQHDGPMTIHNRSVEEYQQIYHSVVDDMLRYGCAKNHQDYFNDPKMFHSMFPYISFLLQVS